MAKVKTAPRNEMNLALQDKMAHIKSQQKLAQAKIKELEDKLKEIKDVETRLEGAEAVLIQLIGNK